MALSTRGLIKRDFDFAKQHIEKSQEFIVRNGAQYQEGYPQYYEMFSALVGLLEFAKQSIEECASKI